MRNSPTKTILQSPAGAVKRIKSGDRVFVQGAAMTPHKLLDALCERGKELKDVEIIHIHTEGPAKYTDVKFQGHFHHNACFVGGNTRKAVAEGNADYIPVFLSEMPLLFRRGILPIDVALISVSPPDKHGFCSLGSSIDMTLGALESAKLVIAQVNPNVPRTHGEGTIHWKELDIAVEVDEKLPVASPRPIGPVEESIGRIIAEMIPDGATMQMGIGAIPDAVLAQLKGHKRLGVHTEMFSDGLIDLVDAGIVTGEEKRVDPTRIVATFAMGSQRLFDFIDDNPMVNFKDASYTNDTAVIRKNPKVVAINSAIEIDLTGQVCADSIGSMQFSGVGGQMDFIRGASLSEGGLPIIALGSQTPKGISKIVPTLKPGASVTTTRAHVHHVVTEYGARDLYGMNLRQRAKALIEIAHPDHRAYLEKEAFERFKTL